MASKRPARRGLWTALLLAVAIGAAILAHRATPETAQAAGPVEIAARSLAFDPADPKRTRFGALEWRGSLLLSGPEPFGGLSAIALSADGADLTAVSDRGFLLTGRLRYAGGRAVALETASMMPLPGAAGEPLSGKADRDAEGLAFLDSGAGTRQLLISFERNHRIGRYAVQPDGTLAPAGYLSTGAAFGALPANAGIEALGLLPGAVGAQRIVAIAERALDANGNHTGWIIAPDGSGETFAVRRSDEFDVTDLAILPGGDMVLLERRFTPLIGGAFRLRRIAHAAIRPGALVDGPVLLQADDSFEIDNMEGLAVHRGENGEIVLTLVSDDNFSLTQRTLLVQFALADGS